MNFFNVLFEMALSSGGSSRAAHITEFGLGI